MTRRYSARTFIRQMPNALLRAYFEAQQIDFNINWACIGETDVAPFDAALNELAPDVRRQVECDFSQVNDLATPGGVQVILEDAALFNRDWSDRFAEMANDYERAMWTFLNESHRFEVAGAFHEMDRASFSWHRFVGTRMEVQTDEDAVATISEELARYYRKQNGARYCHVDVYPRSDPHRYCFFAYPEDAPRTDLGYDDSGQFQRRSQRSAVEVIFIYRPEEGLLDLYARGDKRSKESLAEIFCVNVLGMTRLPDENQVPLNLDVFKDPSCVLPTEPADRILSIDVRLLRLDFPLDAERGKERRITLEAKSTPDAPNAVYQLLDETIHRFNVHMAEVRVGRVKLCFTFMPVENERSKTLTFELSYPNRCTLKDDAHDQIAYKCLCRAGVIQGYRDAAVLAKAS